METLNRHRLLVLKKSRSLRGPQDHHEDGRKSGLCHALPTMSSGGNNRSRFFRFKRKWTGAGSSAATKKPCPEKSSADVVPLQGLQQFRNDITSSSECVTERDSGTARATADQKTPAKPVKRGQLTPLENQVLKLKALHPGLLLMIECGYRYRFFGLPDAEVASKVLSIQVRKVL